MASEPAQKKQKRGGTGSNLVHSGEVAVVTGGARGLGLAIAKRLSGEGAHVALLDLRASDLQATVQELEAAGCSSVSSYALDVSDEKQVQSVMEQIHTQHGRIDILVQSAGITGRTGVKTHEVDPADFDRVLAVNTRAIFLCCRAVLPFMLKRNYGRIVNIASIAGKEGNAGMLAYSTSKAAVIGLTKVIGKEYAETGITCNALAPAVVRTAMVAAMPDQQVKYMTDKIPMKRCGTEDEIADMVSFMASSKTSFTTGFTFDATGGRATY